MDEPLRAIFPTDDGNAEITFHDLGTHRRITFTFLPDDGAVSELRTDENARQTKALHDSRQMCQALRSAAAWLDGDDDGG